MTGTAEHNGVWILAEQSDGAIRRISYELLTRGRALADKRHTQLIALLIGHELDDADLRTLIACGADRVVTMEAASLAKFLVEPYAACVQKVIETYRPEIIIAGATSTGRTLMPYVAVKVHAGLTADCTQLDIDVESGQLLQTRPAIGGNIMATIRTPNHRPQMATVRPRSTPPAAMQEGRTGEIVRLQVGDELLASRITHVGFIADDSEHGMQDADAVLAVGRGVRKAENLPAVKETAQALNAALAASREVVDRGWLSYPHQVGLSGKTVSPKLYFAVGVSGAIQHLAGMQTAETIVAINSDTDAPIFGVADFGIVGDMFEVLPRLCRRLRREKNRCKT
jgi:electron transfer flavoprotein alpha subunit